MFIEEGVEILLLGKGLERHPNLSQNSSIPHKEIPSGLPVLSHPIRSISQIASLLSGYRKACREFVNYQPDITIGFGSYHSLPVLLAALRNKIPIFLHEQNLIPGKVNKLFSRFARGVGLSFRAASEHFPCRAEEVSLPRRKYAQVNCFVKDFSQLSPKICVVGGSQGAKVLNTIVPPALATVSKQYGNLCVYHITGMKNPTEPIQLLYDRLGIPAYVKNFEGDMLSVLQSSDLVISRAGATILDEILWAQVPSVLVPYPGAYGHQEENAKFLAYTLGAGSMLLQKQLSKESLATNVLLALDSQTIQNRRQALQIYNKKKVAKSFYQFICECL
ncbi:glycosyltransferase family 28 C-terminal domain protein [Chlamydia ibidis]|uniref:Glycosyltransferase family 28 C-terminal domain protein n=3 Tax=Chlamydia ibidis TaxID=1405396 RepID=S7J3U5_9CHLA|nr:glycosyltransferase family 28 C-terminal domain protein [Chlamydia ibidis]EQM62421.1 glycosyltransferase family 28 N-terminal domain protein [Chlamydia ibidis 10-1398/6]